MIPAARVCALGEDIHQVMLRYTAPESNDCNDLQLFMLNSVDTGKIPDLESALGHPIAMSITVVLAKPKSRGRVQLNGADVDAQPGIYLNCATSGHDLRRLREGVRMAWRILQSPAIRRHVSNIFVWNDKIVNSDQLLSETISTFVRGSWHPVGTAKMGPVSDPMAVVDQYGNVYGCERLVVADASIMPDITRSPTNLTCIMIGEKISEYLKDGKVADGSLRSQRQSSTELITEII